MLRSLFSGISGLRSHQTMMDVTGNNIANVNTAGFKSSTTVFQDTLSQYLRGAGAPTDGMGGTNPAQVGLGTRIAGITTNFAQGAAQSTGSATDLRIEGDGFFVVKKGMETLYSRAGAFSFDSNGSLTTPDGLLVQGWSADASGAVDANGPLGPVRLPVDTILQPAPTQAVSYAGNLAANSYDPALATQVALTKKVTGYDALGNELEIGLSFTPASADSWTVEASSDGVALGSPVTIAFDSAGRPTGAEAAGPVDFGGIAFDITRISHFGGQTTVSATAQDGRAMGSLSSFTLSPDGVLLGVFSNGLKQPLGQIALANFNNPPGLEKIGGSLYGATINSGIAQVGVPGQAGRGLLSSGTLEMSNVDLAQEFTNLIVAQRGFQANSRVITSSDEMLQDLVNLKR